MEVMTDIQIETPYGTKILNVLCGDIADLNRRLDVMTVSAFYRDYSPTPRTVVAALAGQGVRVGELASRPALDLRELGNIWLSEEISGAALPIGRIGCIEMSPYTEDRSAWQDREERILGSIRSYFRMLDLVSVSGVRIESLGLPLLGTGSQQISMELITIPILNECLRYLRGNETIREISIITRSPSKAYRLAKALDSSYALVRGDHSVQEARRSSRDLPLAFISYASEDRNVADNLCAKLEAAGIRVWYAPRNVDATDYASSIVGAISRCTHFIVVISRNSLRSEHVLNEIDLAFHELERKMRLCPLRLDDEAIGPAFRYYLSRQHWMDAQLPPLEKRLDEFVQKLAADLAR